MTVANDEKNIPLVSNTTYRTFDYYLLGEIGAAAEYKDLLHSLNTAEPQDSFRIHINSEGGSIYSAIQIMSSIRNCTCRSILVNVEGLCASASTIIFLACDTFIIQAHSSFLFHNYSCGMSGKGGELQEAIAYDKEWSETLFTNLYQDLLTKKELGDMLLGKDIWMSGEEVEKRLPSYCKKRNARVLKETK